MKRVLVTCMGISPMLMNPATPELLMQIRNKTTPPRRTDWSVEEEASTRLCYGDHYGAPGQIGIPALNLYSALVKAGRKHKMGRTQISTATTTTLPSFLSIEDEFLVLKGHDVANSWEADVRRGTNPNGGELVVLVRPKFREWEFDVTIQFDDDKANEQLIKALFETAGSSLGLGDFRPGKGGPFGRFAVSKWAELDGSTNGKAVVGAKDLETIVA